mgnify:CR=1 FL=1
MVFMTVIFISCNREKDFIAPSDYGSDPQQIFEAFWNGIDQNYVFFNYDPVDWDQIYNSFAGKVNASTTNTQLINIFTQMMEPLIDHHKILKVNDKDYGGVFNSNYTKNYPITNFESLVLREYLDTAGRFKLSSVIDEDNKKVTVDQYFGGKIRFKKIFYFRSRTFIGNALQDEQFKSEFIYRIDTLNSKGYDFILDLRNNGGGNATEFAALVSLFPGRTFTWGYSKVRTARDRFTMSPYFPETIPSSGPGIKRKIAVLVNRYSFSAAELTTMALSGLPNVVVIGDTTGGATGPISDETLFTGSFTLPNGWKVQLAQRATFDINKKIYEGKGIAPDISVKESQTAIDNGNDLVLDKAIDYLGTH